MKLAAFLLRIPVHQLNLHDRHATEAHVLLREPDHPVRSSLGTRATVLHSTNQFEFTRAHEFVSLPERHHVLGVTHASDSGGGKREHPLHLLRWIDGGDGRQFCALYFHGGFATTRATRWRYSELDGTSYFEAVS